MIRPSQIPFCAIHRSGYDPQVVLDVQPANKFVLQRHDVIYFPSHSCAFRSFSGQVVHLLYDESVSPNRKSLSRSTLGAPLGEHLCSLYVGLAPPLLASLLVLFRVLGIGFFHRPTRRVANLVWVGCAVSAGLRIQQFAIFCFVPSDSLTVSRSNFFDSSHFQYPRWARSFSRLRAS